jgi:hypothetical protein
MQDDDVKVWDLLNFKSPRSEDELRESRLKICRECEFFKPASQKCKKCGCFMKLKVTLEHAKCPIGKW